MAKIVTILLRPEILVCYITYTTMYFSVCLLREKGLPYLVWKYYMIETFTIHFTSTKTDYIYEKYLDG